MTKGQRRQFYNRLRKVRGKFKWYVDELGIRAESPGQAIGTFCPLTAICFSETGKRFGTLEADEQYVDVGMELKREDRETIMNAADIPRDDLMEKEEKVLRKTMLNILGLNK